MPLTVALSASLDAFESTGSLSVATDTAEVFLVLAMFDFFVVMERAGFSEAEVSGRAHLSLRSSNVVSPAHPTNNAKKRGRNLKYLCIGT